MIEVFRGGEESPAGVEVVLNDVNSATGGGLADPKVKGSFPNDIRGFLSLGEEDPYILKLINEWGGES